jgi:hypothetical protein
MPSSRHVALVPNGEVGSLASSTLVERPFYLIGSLVVSSIGVDGFNKRILSLPIYLISW